MRHVSLGLVLSAAMAAGCHATEGPLFAARGDGGTVQPAMRLQYQLTDRVDTAADADLFVVDLFETTLPDIERLHALNKVVIAYVAAGSYEPWRPDVAILPDSVIGNPLAGYPDEAWLDVRDASVRELLVGRLTLAADKGFDGVLLASLDGYLANSGHDLSPEEQLTYNLWLADRAAQAGLGAGVSSDWPHAAALAEVYRFAIDIQCLAAGRCAELEPYRARGRAIFDLETDAPDIQRTCAQASAQHLPVTCKNGSFDAWLSTCP